MTDLTQLQCLTYGISTELGKSCQPSKEKDLQKQLNKLQKMNYDLLKQQELVESKGLKKASFKENKQQIQKLETTIRKLEYQISELKTKKKIKTQEIKQIKHQKDQLENEVQNNRNQILRQANEIISLKKLLEIKTNENSSEKHTEQVQSGFISRSDLNQFQVKIASLTSENLEFKYQIAQLQQIEMQRFDTKQLQNQIKTIQEQKKQVEESCQNYLQEINQLKSTLFQKEQQITQLQNRDPIEVQSRDFQSENWIPKKLYEKAQKDYINLQQSNQQINELLQVVTQSNLETQEKINSYKLLKKNKKLKQNLKEIMTKIQILRSDILYLLGWNIELEGFTLTKLTLQKDNQKSLIFHKKVKEEENIEYCLLENEFYNQLVQEGIWKDRSCSKNLNEVVLHFN